ncbi:DMT family transporter [Betaproteobacteria bacterium SCN2]|jgi:drug/metabolite transporter (DMT)-like permease|nr:DMT family transporter [Betaproteobacteria bacterium SCN2]
MPRAGVFLLTLLAMLAFAANSVLCRAALKDTAIDAASFTAVRLLAGALALWLIVALRNGHAAGEGSWPSALALFAYAAPFSFAYVSLSAGAGALLLFGAVQATMILWGWWRGERLNARQLAGLALALGGLAYLMLPGISAPPLGGALLMIAAGIAWGAYSLRGRGAAKPLAATAGNFLRTVPLGIALAIVAWPWLRFDIAGIAYAIASGALASGIGYAIWYAALPGLRAASAATVQLSVPVIVALGGVLLLGEPVTLRLALASVAILGGIALVIAGRHQSS